MRITIDAAEATAEADRLLCTEPAIIPGKVATLATRAWWEVKADDPDDEDPIIVRTAVPNDTIEVEIVVPDGWSYLSPNRAKALAYVLLAAADEAENAVLLMAVK